MRMMMIYSSVCLQLILVGCESSTHEEILDVIPIVVVDDSTFNDYYITPWAETSVENGEIERDLLQLTVSFLGGCVEHKFGLICAKSIAKSNPPIALVLLTHDARSDTCKDNIAKEMLFDLSPFREYLQSSGLLESGTIIIPLKGLGVQFEYKF